MTKNPTQDIYGTDRRKRHEQPFSNGAQNIPLAQPWMDAMRQRRRSSFFLALIVLVVTALVGTVAVQQYLLSTRRTTGKWVVRPPPGKAGATSPLDLNADPQTQFLMDELTELPVLSIPEKGDMPLNIQWVKQAAYHLMQAEKASKEERLDQALEAYQKTLLIFPQLQGVHRSMGLIYLRQKDYPSAASMFEKVTTEEEMTFGLANNLGVAYLALEDFKKAEENFLLATRLNPRYALAYFNLATLYLRSGDMAKSASHFEKYIELRPDDISAAQTYAMVLVQLKQWDRAVTLLDQIARVAPDVAPIHFRLAEALAHTGNREAALQSLRRATSLVDARKALAWMSRPEFDPLRNDVGFRHLLNELGAAE